MGSFFLWLIVGYILYRVFKGYMRFQKIYYAASQYRNFTLTYDAMANSELGLLVSLVAKVAKSDGRVDELEAQLVSHVLNDVSRLFPDKVKAKELLKEIFNKEKDDLSNVDEVAAKLYMVINKSEYKRSKMMEFLVNLAYCDGKLDDAEDKILKKISLNMYFSESELKSLYSKFDALYSGQSVNSLENAYKVLGVSAEDDMKSIKKAYRELVKQYHPDIIQAHGASDDYVQEATQKIQEINAAYELIKKSRG
jgi:DnaJ like chaperone protein